MRIAVVAPVWIPVPPEGYGGVELVVSLLVEELVARGHDVTLFASGGSVTSARLVSAYEVAPTERIWEVEPDAVHVGTAFSTVERERRAGRPFDLVHDHTGYLGAAFAEAVETPVVHTVHLLLDDDRRAFYARFGAAAHLVAISDHQREAEPGLPWIGRVHNAVDVESFPFREEKEPYLVSLGRVCERKGQDLAIRVAEAAGLPLILAGRVHPAEAEFFEQQVLPHVDGERVAFLGEVSNERKRELLAGATALLFPVREPEPFGLVMAEAMACGTPVVAEPLGAVPEVVVDGETGLFASGVEAMAAAVLRVKETSPRRCREVAAARFRPSVMVDGYESVYRDVLERR